MELYGKKISKADITRYVGDVSQIADAKEAVMTSGKADGVRVIDVKTGSGLTFSVIPSRGLDIAWAEFKGIPIAFISKTGMVSPAYFEKDGLGFLRGFYCGLLTTCGLTYMGAPCVDEGEELGLHGRISNIPAQNVCVDKDWEGDDYIIRIRGKVQQSCVFKENLVLAREITVKMGGKSISVKDSVKNCGFSEQPFMLLYHCNFGYPIVSESTILVEPKVRVVPRDDEAKEGISDYMKFQKPTPNYTEQVFYHDIEALENNKAYACLYNEEIGLGAYVKFDRKQFRHFGQWKMMGEGDYVVGLEPATWLPEGRSEARKHGELDMIQPGEIRVFEYELGVVESRDDISEIV
jgi:hypothetical protein